MLKTVNGIPTEMTETEIAEYEASLPTAEQIRIASIHQSITALQGLLAIDAAGLSTAYEAWANDAARTFAEKAFINRAQIWKRDDVTLLSATALFGLTETQVDELFILGGSL